MVWYFAALFIIAGFLFMEFVAWFSHKYVMHGFLWVLHKDHHIRDGRKFEYNDLFAVIFAIPAFLAMYFGLSREIWLLFYFGIGIAAYGLAYFLFHDVYVHQRIKLGRMENKYLRATLKAHEDHHKPHAHYNYGFLLAPMKYYREEFSKKSGTQQS